MNPIETQKHIRNLEAMLPGDLPKHPVPVPTPTHPETCIHGLPLHMDCPKCESEAKRKADWEIATANKTPPKWSAMTPREQDALVATKVMGWEMAPHKTFWVRRDDNAGNMQAGNAWSPTTCPKACAEVKAKAIWCQVHKRVNGKWTVIISFEKGRAYTSEAKTEEQAVCLAALRSTGVEVGE